MRTNLTIKNFRVFDENGVTIELNPITILTGCNSSGKSSVVKAVFLLNSFLSKIKKDIDNGNSIKLNEYKLDFSTYPNNLLGRFDKVVHASSVTKKITLEYTVYSLMLSKDVTVQLVFYADSMDELNNAYLDSISFGVKEGIFFTSSSESVGLFSPGNTHNYNIIKKECLDFFQIDFLANYYFSLYGECEIEGSVSTELFEKEKEKIVSELKRFDKQRISDVVNRIRNSGQKLNDFIRKNKVEYEVVDWTRDNGSFFMIPVIDSLDKIPKEQLWSYVDKEIVKREKDDIVSIASKKIIDGFVASDAKTFREFFRGYENRFFDRQESRNVNQGNQYGEGPNLAPGLGIHQMYIFDGPTEKYILGSVNFDDEMETEKTQEVETDSSFEQRYEAWKNQIIDFDMIYEIVMLWNTMAGNDNADTNKYYVKNSEFYLVTYQHRMCQLLSVFVSELLKSLVTPEWCGMLDYVSSSRVNVKRVYSLDNSDFALLVQKYFEEKYKFQKNGKDSRHDFEIGEFLNEWIKKLELGESISIDNDNEGLGFKLILQKAEGGERRLLADEGYGITQLVSMLIQIETAILSSRKKKRYNYIGMEAFRGLIDDDEGFEEYTIAIEEPEIHLHPAFQSKLADMMIEAYKKYNVHFIVETHSEYLIRKLQALVAGKDDEFDLQISVGDISIIYVNSPQKTYLKGVPQVKRIEICADGYLDDTFGEGFFDEAAKWSKKLIF